MNTKNIQEAIYFDNRFANMKSRIIAWVFLALTENNLSKTRMSDSQGLQETAPKLTCWYW